MTGGPEAVMHLGADGRALGHIRICDLSGQLAGAGATRFLAAFGAQVIRVEDPVTNGSWDVIRGSPPHKDGRPGIERGGAFNDHNVGKLGITLDLRTDRGRELLAELVKISDVVTENFSAGVLGRLGFGYERLRELRDDIVYVSNCGFGHVGPYSRFRSWGPVVQAVSGLTFQTGVRDQPPAGHGFSYMDHTGGYYMVMAILSALHERDRTGQGQWVDLSCTDAAASLNGPVMLDATVNARPFRRPGMPDSSRENFPAMAPHGIYATRSEPEGIDGLGHDDNWIAIACRDDEEWRAIAEEVAEPWACAERFATQQGRIALRDELDGCLEEFTRRRGRHELAAALSGRGVPAAPVARPAERIELDPWTRSWGLWPMVTHREIGEVRVDGLPVHLEETDWSMTRGAPCLGEHNEFVLEEILGLGRDEIEGLRTSGII